MSKMYIVIGAPGCGKSYYIQQHKKDNEIVISRDKIRFEKIKENEEYFSKEKEVYNDFIQQINNAILNNQDVWVDQTSLTMASRNKLFSRLIKKPEDIIGIYFNTSLDTIFKRNAERIGRAYVPENIIINMYNSLEKPLNKEGFTDIWEIDE